MYTKGNVHMQTAGTPRDMHAGLSESPAPASRQSPGASLSCLDEACVRACQPARRPACVWSPTHKHACMHTCEYADCSYIRDCLSLEAYGSMFIHCFSNGFNGTCLTKLQQICSSNDRHRCSGLRACLMAVRPPVRCTAPWPASEATPHLKLGWPPPLRWPEALDPPV